MRIKPIALSAIAALLAIFVWYVSRTPDINPPTPTVKSPVVQPTTTVSTPIAAFPIAPQPSDPKVEILPEIEPTNTQAPAWEMDIHNELIKKVPHDVMAKSILQQVPSMPPEGQHAAAQHITNLLSDSSYLDVLPYLQNPSLSNAFQEIIYGESLNRPNAVKLPIILAAARRIPAHPMRDNALTILTILTGENHGTDWQKWQAEIDKILSKPADQ